MSPVDLFYGIAISALFAFEVNRVLRARRSFVPPQPMPENGPYRSSGGSPGNRAIDILIDEFERDAPGFKPHPEAADTMTIEHRVDELLAVTDQQEHRLRELEKRASFAFRRFGLTMVVVVMVGMLTLGAHAFFSLCR